MVDPAALIVQPANVLEAIRPFQADDGHKGTFLVLRIAGMEQGMTLRTVNRKYRSWQNWRATDEYFREIDDAIPFLAQKFGGEARVVRTALLDVSIIETGINIFRRILSKQPVSEGMWAYAVKMAGLRVPMMGGTQESKSPWERLANSVQATLAQREVTVVQELNGAQSITAREMIIEPSPEQRKVAAGIVQRMIQQAQEGAS